MRRPLLIPCEGEWLAAMAHPAGGTTGVLMVAGGPQTRAGSHRGLVTLADRLAEAGHSVLRFDRRGMGDSGGAYPGFRGLGPDVAAAREGLRRAFPDVVRTVGWGLCDGAAALAMNADGFDALILVNPWTIDAERAPELPQGAAIAARYRARLASPRGWADLARGRVSLGKVTRGLGRLLRPEPVSATARAIVDGLARFAGPVLIVLAERDNTAQAFAALWRGPLFARARARGIATVVVVPGATHTFARPEHGQALAAACLDFLG